MTPRARRWNAATPAVLVLTLAVLGALLPAPGSAAAPEPDSAPRPPVRTWIDDAVSVTMPDGGTAYVRPDGDAMIISADGGAVTMRRVEDAARYRDLPRGAALPSKDELARELSQAPRRAYRPDVVLITFADGTAQPGAGVARTGDAATDAALARLGATTATPVLGAATAADWRQSFVAAELATGQQLLDPARTFSVVLDGGVDAYDASEVLLELATVDYASPAWSVSSPTTGHVPVPSETAAAAIADGTGDPTDGIDADDDALRLPGNDALRSNAQSHWNTPALDAATAYDRITRELGELPGTGEIITTVGLGPLTSDPTGPCAGDVEFFGPTTTVIDDQRYVDHPSMPLIPTFTADTSGALDPLGEVCPIPDPVFAHLGLTLSVMAPLPHARQRPEAVGAGLTDLLGLAPGAEYRVVVPGDKDATTLDFAGALIGAAQQEPAPTVITASAHIGGDDVGFPNRTLEDDELLRSVITTIVAGQGITVTTGAGDGVTTNRATAFGPTGGAVPTQLTADGESPTRLSDLRLSTAPSRLPDTGSIMVGATTLNDVAADPPHLTDDPRVRAGLTYPAVRWTGSTAYASGFGARVDLAAPGDSVIGFLNPVGGGPRDVRIQLGSGTGVAAAEVAAAAAIVRHVSRAMGEPIEDPAAVRAFLSETGRAVAEVPQAMGDLDVGPLLDLGAAVRELFDRAELPADEPGVLRVAIAQRRPVASQGAVFETWTDRRDIDLTGPPSPVDGQPTGRNARAWITVAPDWVGLPEDATYTLRVAGRDGGLLASTAWARLQPAEILAAAGLPLADVAHRDLPLIYLARVDGKAVASATITLGFSESDGISQQVHAPEVEPVISGTTMRVAYDLTDVAPVIEPELMVSFPGRPKPELGPLWVPDLRIPLDDLVGTVDIPVSDLEGGGLYGVTVNFADQEIKGFPYPLYSDFAYARLAPTSDARPPAPLLARADGSGDSPRRHFARLGANDSLTLRWDASAVPGASGARLEVSAAGPTIAALLSTFNNPDGTERDHNGNDTGSVAMIDLPGVIGTTTLAASELGLYSTMRHGLRVVAVDAQGNVVGSAGAVSSVAYDGVKARRGTVERGYGIDPAGGRGLLTTYEIDSVGERSGVSLFDLEGMAVTGQAIEESSTSIFHTLGSGVYGKPTGLVQEIARFTGEPLGQWVLPGLRKAETAWSGPQPSRYTVALGGSDLPGKQGAFLLRDSRDEDAPFRLVRSRVPAEEFGPVHDISEPLGDLPLVPSPFTMAYDRAAGVAAITYAYDLFAPPSVEIVDIATGDAFAVEHEAFLYPGGVDVLSPPGTPGLVAFTTIDSLLTSSSLDGTEVRSVAMPDGVGSYVIADDEHGLILVAQANSDPGGMDKNDLSSVRIYNAELELIDTVQRFNMYDTAMWSAYPQLQVDPATRTGWFFGPLQEQLATFAY